MKNKVDDRKAHSIETKAITRVSPIREPRAELEKKLAEALEQQTATNEVLKVISRSSFDPQLVLESLLKNAIRLCGADRGFVYRQDGEVYRVVASYGRLPEFIEIVQRNPIRQDRSSATGRAVLECRVVHIHDVLADSDYRWAEDHRRAEELGRTILAVPILKEDAITGVLVIVRIRVEPFTDKQIELVTTFAAQAAIAIENVRLFEDVQARTREISEALEQQTVTANILKVINSSTFDLQRVFEALLENAVRFCGAKHGMVFRYDGECCRAAAAYNTPPKYFELWDRTPIRAGRDTATGRALLERCPVQIRDIRADPEYNLHEAQKLMAYRTVLAVPLLREGFALGTIELCRTEVAPFTDKQMELLIIFADQAVTAIEKVRLLDEIQEKNRQLELASEHKSQFVASMSQELRPPLNTIIGITETMVTNAARFGTEKAQEPLQRVHRAGTNLLGLIDQALDLSKIEAGKLELNPATVNLMPLIDEVIGTARKLAEQNKNSLVVEAADNLGGLTVDPVRLRQILLNLLSNACKFTKQGEVKLRARRVADGRDWIELAVADSGSEFLEQLRLLIGGHADTSSGQRFGGAGLALAITRRLARMMGGDMTMASEPGKGSVFTVRLPVGATA